MKTGFLAIITLFAYVSYAQNTIDIRYPYPEWDLYKKKPQGDKANVSIYTKTRKGKRLEKTLSFNPKGLIEQEKWYKRNGKIERSVICSYNDSDDVTSRRDIVRNKIRNLYEYQYNSDLTLLTQTKSFYKDTLKARRITEYEYTLGKKYKSITGYNGDRRQLYRYEYDYYENGSRKESRYYKKNKLKNTWVFDCNLTGELSQPHTEKICKSRTYEADSSFTEVYDNTYKGKVRRTIIKSTADGRVLENSVLDAKGRLKSKSVYEYNAAKKLVKHRVYKGNSTKPNSMELYEYGTDSNLITSIRLSGNGDIKYRKEYTYN